MKPARQGSGVCKWARNEGRLPLLGRREPEGQRGKAGSRSSYCGAGPRSRSWARPPPPLLDVIKGILQVELLGLHEVSHADGGRREIPASQ